MPHKLCEVVFGPKIFAFKLFTHSPKEESQHEKEAGKPEYKKYGRTNKL